MKKRLVVGVSGASGAPLAIDERRRNDPAAGNQYVHRRIFGTGGCGA